MELRELQKAVGEWSVGLFGDNNRNFSKLTGLPQGSQNALTGLVEEVGELNRVHICSHQGRRGYDVAEKRYADKRDAVADIMIFLLDYCHRENIDLQDSLEQTWNKVVSKRNLENWSDVSHDNDTVVEGKQNHPIPTDTPKMLELQLKIRKLMEGPLLWSDEWVESTCVEIRYLCREEYGEPTTPKLIHQETTLINNFQLAVRQERARLRTENKQSDDGVTYENAQDQK